MQQQWEYRYTCAMDTTIEDHLNTSGPDGWEAVGLTVDADFNLHVPLKRLKEKPVQEVTQTRYRDRRLSGRRAR